MFEKYSENRCRKVTRRKRETPRNSKAMALHELVDIFANDAGRPGTHVPGTRIVAVSRSREVGHT